MSWHGHALRILACRLGVNFGVGVGIGVEASGVGVGVGVGVDIQDICRSLNWSWNSRSWSWNWSLNSQELELELELKFCQVFFYSSIIWNMTLKTGSIILCLITRQSVFLKFWSKKDHDFFDFVWTIQAEIFCPLGPYRGIVLRYHRDWEGMYELTISLLELNPWKLTIQTKPRT